MSKVVVLSSGLPSSNVLTMAPLARQISSLQSIGVDVTTVNVTGPPKIKYITTVPRIRRALETADLIHGHFGYCGWLAKLSTRKPVVVSFMGDDLLGTPREDGSLLTWSRMVVRANKWLASRIDAIIVKSEEMAEVLRPLSVHVIPNGIDVEAFTPIDSAVARKRLGWSANRKYVLFPGNPALPRKCFPLAEASVRAAERRIGQSIEIVVLWNVPPESVPLYMNACDAMLMTSFVEGSPNVVKEAMACDLPVIAVPVGDVAQILEGVSGYAVRPREADAIAEILAVILSERPACEGRKAIIEKGLDLQSVARRIQAVYEQVISDQRHRGTNGRGNRATGQPGK